MGALKLSESLKQKYIDEDDVPKARGKWYLIFYGIPEGKALVFKGHEGFCAKQSLLQFRRRRGLFKNYRVREVNGVVYIINPKKVKEEKS